MEEPADNTQPTPEQAFQHVDETMLEQVEALWETLSATDREIIRLRFFTSPPLDYQAIAAALAPGWTSQQVQEHVHHLLNRFRTSLDSTEQAGE